MTKTILIIDDEDDIREVAQLSLEVSTSWNVQTASSGTSGIALAAELKPDAILLDVMMPGLDGPATLEQLRTGSATASIPVIFLTAKVRSSEKERLATLGVVAVLSKPFDPVLLAGEIAAVLGWAA